MSLPARPTKSLLRTTLVVLPAQIIFRGGEAVLPLLLAFWFGRSHATDVYKFAQAVFMFAAYLVFSAYQDSALVPILAEERLARRAEIPRLLGSLLAHTWAIGGAVAVAMGALATAWFRIRYDGPDFALAARMVVPFTLLLPAIATRTFFATLLTVERHFVVQPIASGLGMCVNVAVLWTLHASAGIAIVPVAALAGELVATGLLAWFAIRIVGVRIVLGFARPPAFVGFARLVWAEVAGGAVTRINPVVDQFMAALSFVVGGGTMLALTNDVATLPTSILQASLLPVLLSHLSEDFAARDLKKLRHTVVRALASVALILLAATLLLFLIRAPLLRLVFLRGEMDAAGVDRMIRILPYHLVGIVPFGALLVVARAHVAIKNSAIMLSMGTLNAVCNAVFNLIMLKAIGLEGIALSTSCVHLAVAIVFWFRFEARIAALKAA